MKSLCKGVLSTQAGSCTPARSRSNPLIYLKMTLYSRFFSFCGKRDKAFTLIELMVAIAIVGTLAGIAIPVYSNQIKKARIFKAISDIQLIQTEIDLYKEDNDTLPASLDDIGRSNTMDPWGNPYQYANHALIKPGKRRKYHGTVPLNLDYDLFSMGPDGKFKPPLTAKQSQDDIIRADDGNYIGPASEY